MSKRDDWIDYFELLHGRKPNAEEYMEAKEAGKFESVPDDTGQSVQGQSSPQAAPSVEQYDVAETSGFDDRFASEHLHEQTNIVGEGPKQDYQEATIPNYYNTQTNMGGEGPSTKQDYQGEAIPNYYNTSKDQYASPFLVDQRGQEITFGRALADYFRGYWSFNGFTSRKGYWSVVFFNLVAWGSFYAILSFLLISKTNIYLLDYLFFNPLLGLSIYSILWLPYLVLILPGLTLNTRRLRDAGLRGRGIFVLYLFTLVPFVNIISSIFSLYALCQKSDHFLQNGESFFYRNRAQSPGLPNLEFPQKKSLGGFFGGFLIFLGIVLPLILVLNVNNFNNNKDYSHDSSYYDGQTVDLSQYEVSLNVDGENGSGVASVHIDATPSVSSSSSEIKEFLENPQITVSKETGLSDGDTVDVEITLDEDKASELGLTVTGTSYHYFVVSNLGSDGNASSKTSSNNSSSNSSSQNTSSEQDTKKNIETFMTNFRSDINRTIKESSDYVYSYFESKDNATYKSIIDIYLQNPDHYDYFESKTDNIYDIKENGDQVTFTIDFTTTTYFTDGKAPATSSKTRHYVCKKHGSSFYIISFDNL